MDWKTDWTVLCVIWFRLATSEKEAGSDPGEWSYKEPALYARKGESSRESRRKRSGSSYRGAYACGRIRRYHDDYRGCA